MRIKQAFSLPRGGGDGGEGVAAKYDNVSGIVSSRSVSCMQEFCLNFKPIARCAGRYRQLRQIPYDFFFRSNTKGLSQNIVSNQYAIYFILILLHCTVTFHITIKQERAKIPWQCILRTSSAIIQFVKLV